MSIRLLFGWGLVALFALLSLLIPGELLPLEEIGEFSTLETADIYAERAQDPAALYTGEGDAVLFNLSTFGLCSAEISWRTGSAGGQRADGKPLMQYESLELDLGIEGTEVVSIAAYTAEGQLLAQGSFTHDFSAGPLVAVLRDGAHGLPVIELFDGQTP